MKLKIEATEENIMDFFSELDEEMKNKILDLFTATQVIDSVARHLKGKGDYSRWDTSGWRWGSEVREAIAKINEIEEGLREDHAAKVRSLEHDVAYNKKYYDWYFKLYHHGGHEVVSDERLYDQVVKKIGRPT